MVKKKTKAFFLDRDGVINRTIIVKGKPVAPRKFKDFKILKDVDKSLIFLKKKGFKNIIITNQPDIKKGLTETHLLKKINSKIKSKLKIDDIYVCQHIESDNCKCRKPNTGLILKAKKKWNIDLKKSYLIGDRWRDIYLANRLKINCFYIDKNYKEKKPKKFNYKVKNLFDAIKEIKKNEKNNKKN